MLIKWQLLLLNKEYLYVLSRTVYYKNYILIYNPVIDNIAVLMLSETTIKNELLFSKVTVIHYHKKIYKRRSQ